MTNVPAKTVLLAAWEPNRTREWRRELVDSGDWQALRPVHSVAEAHTRLAQHPVDLVITDLRLHDGQATDLVRLLRRNARTERTPILVVARGPDPMLLDALQEGADGVLDQSAPGSSAIVEQASDMMRGGVDIAPWIARRLLDFFERAPTRSASHHSGHAPRATVESIANPLELTEAERQLLRHLSVGRRLAEVADQVGLAPVDCTARVRGIHRKMQWSRRAGELTLQAG